MLLENGGLGLFGEGVQDGIDRKGWLVSKGKFVWRIEVRSLACILEHVKVITRVRVLSFALPILSKFSWKGGISVG